jgi:FAD/FMN-containing dehydrogenase
MHNQTLQPLGVVPERINEIPVILQGRLSDCLQQMISAYPKKNELIVVDMRSANRVVEYCSQDQVITVETGISLKQLQAIVEPMHQYFPCTASEEQTVLEVINSGATGPLEHAFALRSLVLGLEVVLANGKTIKTGGKVVKNVTGYDLTKLFIGARGTFGIPVKAHLRLYSKQERLEVFVVAGLTIENYLTLSNRLIASGLPIAAIDLVHNLPIKALGDWPPQACLLVAISEHQEIVNELEPMLEKFFVEAQAMVRSFSDREAETILLEQGTLIVWDRAAFELAVPRSEFGRLQKVILDACPSTQFQYRPGTGSLKAKAESPENLQTILAAIKSYAQGRPLAVAYADEAFEYKVERMPSGVPEVDKLIQSIKTNFDPENRMNPFVKL